MSRSTRRLAGVAVAGLAVASLVAAPAQAGNGNNQGHGNTNGHHNGNNNGHGNGGHHHSKGRLLDIQILSFNDFHGNLEPPSGSSGRIQTGPLSTDTTNAGGVEYLATHLKAARVGHRNTVTVAAGDMVGASPLLSAAFHDEPTIESMNALGLEITAVGNHEFDEGFRELQRLQRGGCIDDGDGANNQNSCAAGKFKGAKFQYLAANVLEKATGKTILPPYAIKKFNGAKVGFIGMTLKDTPNIVTASGVAGLEFNDEVKTANALVPVLRKQGVNAIVVLIHQGGNIPANTPYDFTCQGGGTLSADSPIIPIAEGLDPAIDMIISGHTHQPYVCSLPDPKGEPRLITSASSFGRLYTETDVKYDRRTNDLVRPTQSDAVNRIVTRDVAPDRAQTALIKKYTELVKTIADKVLGQIVGTSVSRTQNAAGESPLGDLIADAQLADPSVVPSGTAAPKVAFMNPGGIRGDLVADAAGNVTYASAFTVQPFNNYLVSMDITGQGIYDLLNEQFSGLNSAGSPKVLQISQGFTYSYTQLGMGTVNDPTDDTASVDEGSVAIDGVPVDKAATYRIVTNNFLSDGGDGFPAFKAGTDKYFGGLDIDGFAKYLMAHSPYTPLVASRITQVMVP